MTRNYIETHYNDVGNRYDRLYQKMFGDNRSTIVSRLAHMIKLHQEQLLVVDLGGGTGTTIALLKEIVDPKHKFILVEPYVSMSDKALLKKNRPDEICNLTAEKYVQNSQSNSFDLIICQEMIHHIHGTKDFFIDAYRVLKTKGTIALITRPAVPEFPLGSNARMRWRDGYEINPDEMPNMLKKIGFSVEKEVYKFPIKMNMADWLELIGPEHLFSTFASMTPQERHDDLIELQRKDNVLQFNDIIYFITAVKP